MKLQSFFREKESTRGRMASNKGDKDKDKKLRPAFAALLFLLSLPLSSCAGTNVLQAESVQETGLRGAEEITGVGGAKPSGTIFAYSDGEAFSADRDTLKDDTGYDLLRVDFVDVGQGDCALIGCGGEYMLIDAGENDRGVQVAEYIEKSGISSLKYAIGTHPHSDHIGGLDVVIDRVNCETVMLPDYERDIKTYKDVIKAMGRRGIENTPPVPGDVYTLGTARFTILGPSDDHDDNINDYSIAVLLENGDTSFLFTGDAEREAEEDILEVGRQLGLDMDIDVYKAGHHGSYSSSSWELLEETAPEAAVISCGRNNDYGYPHDETVDKFRRLDIDVYRTDIEGNISAYSDGKTVVFDTPPSGYEEYGNDNAASCEEGTYDSGDIILEEYYILNTRNRKFHRPSCESAGEIAEHNKEISRKKREALLFMGYKPCGACAP